MRKAVPILVLTILVCQSLHAGYSQLALGGGYECVVILANRLSSEFKGGVDLRKGNGEFWSTPFRVNGQPASGSMISVTLPAFGSTKLLLQGEPTVSIGYLVVFGTGANSGSDVAVAFFYNYYSGGRLVDSVGVPSSQLSARHVFAVERSALVNTAFAWAPDWTALPSFNVTLTLYDTAGNQVQQKTVPFTGHLARYFTEIFDAVPPNFVGQVRVVSPQGIMLTVLRFETVGDSFQLTSTPPGYFTP